MDDEPPIEEYPVQDISSGSKPSEAENSQVRRKALNRWGHLLPAPDREEVYPLETLSAKRGKNRKGNTRFHTRLLGNLFIEKTEVVHISKHTPTIELKIRRAYQLCCFYPQGMDSADDEPPIEAYPVEDNSSGFKPSEAENSQVGEKTLRRFLNRRGHLLPAPDREEVYPLETLSAKRDNNSKRNV